VKRSRLRLVLIVALAAAVVFLAGVQVQKQYGVAGSDAAAAGPAGFTGGPPAGFTPPGQTDQTDQTGQTDDVTATPTDSAAVIGTVVSVQDGVWTVEDLGGTTHEITVDATVRIVQESALAADDVEDGATVDISGTTDDQGRVTATTITVR
jgi:hypothetical protein